MGYKTTTNKEFKGKGFVDFNNFSFISNDRKDNGVKYDLKEIFTRLGINGDELQLGIKVSDVKETVDEESRE